MSFGSWCLSIRNSAKACPLILQVPPPNGKDVDFCAAAPTPRLATGRCRLGIGRLGRGVPLHQLGQESFLITCTQFSRQVDAIDRDMVVAVPIRLLGALCSSWMDAVIARCKVTTSNDTPHTAHREINL